MELEFQELPVWKMSGAQTYPAVQRLEAEVGGHLHVGAAQGEDAQAEIQQLQRQQGSPGVALLRGQELGYSHWVTSADCSHFTQSLRLVHTEAKPLNSLKFNPELPFCQPKPSVVCPPKLHRSLWLEQ